MSFLSVRFVNTCTGLWSWQGGQTTGGNSGSPSTHPVTGAPPQEFSEMMMEMLDQNTSSFDELNMFTGPFG